MKQIKYSDEKKVFVHAYMDGRDNVVRVVDENNVTFDASGLPTTVAKKLEGFLNMPDGGEVEFWCNTLSESYIVLNRVISKMHPSIQVKIYNVNQFQYHMGDVDIPITLVADREELYAKDLFEYLVKIEKFDL